ncbi:MULTISPECIES: ferredoxin Fer [Halorussus]|uniref:ferredoxin Fer n=1 Tax=Halorussus TaxID=1070314 RepID=UPI0020A04C10|nr:ferredoxin Fer [Halorussus vallis]USZ74697.1 2Fe-2S iron-sulfur cluster-binding protein [Halorussus vallis]
MESPFEVLGIDAEADEERIEEAYRERVKRAHPDRGGSVEEFIAVREAYEKIKAGYEETPELTGDDAEAGEGPGRPSSTEAQTDRKRSDRERAARPGSEPDREVSRERVTSEVTYLNYDVLADFGWDAADDGLFRKAADADLGEIDYGRFEVEPGESLLEAAEDRGYAWPFACRGGACANCAIILRDGELSMPASHVLPADLMDRGFRLSCNGMPITAELKVIYNVKHMPELDDLLLPPRPFEQAYPND